MAAECATTEITRMARLLEVSTSGYYKREKRSAAIELTPQLQRRADLEVKILAHFRASDGTYGSPRITADLWEHGDRVSVNTVAKIMVDLGIEGISPRTFKVRTTVVDPNANFPEDLVGGVFDQGRIDAVWTSDITYLTCGDGDMYFCAIKDEHSKRILGWRVDDHMRSELVSGALDDAVKARGRSCAGTILHSDRGSQFTSRLLIELCGRYGLRRSMGQTGVCWDNAGAESLWSTFKHEYYYRHVFATKVELVAAVETWVRRYNARRRHSSIGQVSPIRFELASSTAASAA